jgi:hypothetical protein
MSYDWTGSAGVFLTREALADGYDDHAITRLVRSGEWHRIRRGAYVSGVTWRAMDPVGRHRLTARAVLKTAHPSAALSHTSAVLEREGPVWDVSLDEVHLTRHDGAAGRREAGVVHHCGELGEDEVEWVNGLRAVGAGRSVIELSTISAVESCLVPGNWFLGTGLTTMAELTACAERFRWWPGSLRKHVLTALFDGRNMWPGEARTSYLLWRARLPAPHPQYAVHDAAGQLLGVVDFAWPEFGVFLEFDGRIKYERLLREGETLEQVILREKRREERICAAKGWVCIRITWDDLGRQTATARRIGAVLASRHPTSR